jgi:hypothetical protein
VLLVLIVTSGFAIVRTSIPPWWIWAYWISPFAYGLRAVVVNEMTSAAWNYADANTPPGLTVGIASLESFAFQTERWLSAPNLDQLCSNLRGQLAHVGTIHDGKSAGCEGIYSFFIVWESTP